MSNIKIHDTGIPVEGLTQAVEIPFPFNEAPLIPNTFLNKLFGMESASVHEMVKAWFKSTYPCVTAKLALYHPYSIVLYGEIPFIRMERPGGETICIPPPDFKQIDTYTNSKRAFDYPENFSVFFYSLSGIHEAVPWHAESFPVHQDKGMLHPSIIENDFVVEPRECNSEMTSKFDDQQQLLELIYEGGSCGFLVDSAGLVFSYYGKEISFRYNSISDMVDSLFANVELPFFCFDEKMISAYKHFPAYEQVQ